MSFREEQCGGITCESGDIRVLTFGNLGRLGRLGNQLWQITSTLSVADGESVSFPRWKYEQWFSFPDVFRGAEGREVTDTHDRYMQDLAYLNPIADKAREWLKPSARAQMLLDRHVAELKPEECAAVHVRRGDYAVEWGGSAMLPPDWYLYNWPAGRVLVFSDEPDWCRQHLPGEVVHVRDWVDLMLMSMCRQFTISNSTFAWWAAWLSGKVVVAPSPWMPWRDFNVYPGHWVKVSKGIPWAR
jgi:hypothetical protein